MIGNKKNMVFNLNFKCNIGWRISLELRWFVKWWFSIEKLIIYFLKVDFYINYIVEKNYFDLGVCWKMFLSGLVWIFFFLVNIVLYVYFDIYIWYVELIV